MNWIKISLIVVIIAIIYLSLRLPSPNFQINWNDKLGHLLAYMILTINAGLLVTKKKCIFVSLGVFSLSALLEFLQQFVPGRSVEWADLIANFIGVTIGFIVLTIWHKQLLQLLKNLKLMR